MDNIVDSILQAIDIVSNKNVKDVSFDQTIECEIVNVDDAKNGKYVVSDGSAKFTAYSEKTTYSKGDVVRVKVLEGNYEKPKYIEGLVARDENQPITYLSALNTILDVVDLTQETKSQKFKDTNKTGFGLIANKASEQVKLLWSFNFNDYPNVWLSGVYSSLFIEADFTTVLENVKKGTYGLFLRVGIKLDNGVITTKDYAFDSTEFFGNPYRFVISTNQAKKFNIKNFKQFETVALYFYQKNDFETITGDRYPEAKASNLIVKNIRVGLGTDLAEIQDNSIKLVTLDPAGYYTENDAKKNEYTTPVNIDFLWFNKSEENKYIGFGDGIAKRKINKEFKEKFFEEENGTEKSCFGVSVSGNDSSGYTINTENYDENSYLKAVAEETRLEVWKNGEVPPDRESLEIMANIQDAHNALIEIRNLISQKYEPALNTFKNHMADNRDFNGDALNKYEINFTQLEKYISKNLTDSVTEASFLQYYKNLFKFISFVYYSVKEEPIDELKEIDRIVPETCINVKAGFDNDYYGKLFQNYNIGDKVEEVFVSDSLELIKKKIQYLCPEDDGDDFEFENNIKNNHSNYLSFYNNFKLNLKTIKVEFNKYYNIIKNAIPSAIEITNISSDDDNIKIKNKSNTGIIGLKSIKITVADGNTTKDKDYNLDFYQGYTSSSHTDANKIIEWEKSDYSIFDNLYSIYWYRYVADYIDESETDYFGEKDWQLIDKTYSKYVKNSKKPEEFLFENEGEQTIQKNLGLPIRLNNEGNQIPSINEDDIGKDEQHWNAKPLPSDLSTSLSIVLNPQNTTEKFKVVIVYNHESFVSNEDLVFTNLSHPNNLEKITANEIEIKHSTNSLEHYAVYNAATLQVINDKEAYLNREVQAKYEISEGETFNGYVYWYLPITNTQLDYDYSQMTDFIKEETLKTCGKVPTYTKDEDTFVARENYYESSDWNKILETSGEYCKIKIQEIVKEIVEDVEVEIVKDVVVWVKKASCVISCVERNGKICFSKSISEITTQSDMDAELKFPYRIKSFYDSNNSNNIISCELKKSTETEGLKGEIGFTFSISGSNGTDYTLVIAPEYNSITSFCGTDNETIFYLNARVYDKNTDPVPIREIKLENYLSSTENPYSFSLNENGDATLSNLEAQKVIIQVRLNSGKTPSYAVLKASVKIDELNAKEGEAAPDVWLDALYPISWSDKEYICLSGPKQIVYNSNGVLMNYDKTEYKLQNSQTQEIIKNVPIKITNEDETISYSTGAVNVEILYLEEANLSNYTFIYSENTVLDLKNYLPRLNESNILIPAPLFVDNIGVVPLINFYCNDIVKKEKTEADGTKIIEEQKEKRSIYKQPLVILQSRFESSLLNDWNGNLKIDEKNNYILTAMVGAGVKNQDNSFSGVLMGSMKNGSSGGLSKDGIGLYGIHKGAQSFGFNVDGTAFLGKSGKGRIEFDGNQGLIKSAFWNGTVGTDGSLTPGTRGMAISLETGHIDANRFKLTSEGVKLNSHPEPIDKDYYINIGNSTNYLQLDGTGKLKISVNALNVTSSLGTSNLLNNTAPIEEVGKAVTFKWVTTDNDLKLKSKNLEGNKKVILAFGQNLSFSQNLNLPEETTYVLSGEIYYEPGTLVGYSLEDYPLPTIDSNLDYIYDNKYFYPSIDDDAILNFGTYQIYEKDIYSAVTVTKKGTRYYVKDSNNNYHLIPAIIGDSLGPTDWKKAVYIENKSENLENHYPYVYLTKDIWENGISEKTLLYWKINVDGEDVYHQIPQNILFGDTIIFENNILFFVGNTTQVNGIAGRCLYIFNDYEKTSDSVFSKEKTYYINIDNKYKEYPQDLKNLILTNGSITIESSKLKYFVADSVYPEYAPISSNMEKNNKYYIHKDDKYILIPDIILNDNLEQEIKSYDIYVYDQDNGYYIPESLDEKDILKYIKIGANYINLDDNFFSITNVKTDKISEIYERTNQITVKFELNNKEKSVKLAPGWNQIKIDFDGVGVKAGEDDNTFTCSIDAETSYVRCGLYHFKLESGTIPTAWDQSAEDIEEIQNKQSQVVNNLLGKLNALEDSLNTSFTQDKLFAELSNGYSTYGFWIQDNKMFINANQIASGVIKSQNWALSGGTIDDNYHIVTSGTQGTAFSLATGQIDAHNFRLTSGNNLDLNSNPDHVSSVNNKFLHLGTDENYIDFIKTGEDTSKLSIKVSDFSLTSSIGSRNLLNNTLPLNEIGEMLPEKSDTGWNFADNSPITVISSQENGKKYIKIINSTESEKTIKQNKVEIIAGKKYCLSGQYKTKTIKNLIENSSLSKDNYYFLKSNNSYLSFDQELFGFEKNGSIIFEKLAEKIYVKVYKFYQTIYGENIPLYVTDGTKYYTVPQDAFSPAEFNLPANLELYQKIFNENGTDDYENAKANSISEINASNLYFYCGKDDQNKEIYKQCLLPVSLLKIYNKEVKIKNTLIPYAYSQYKAVEADANLPLSGDKYYIKIDGQYVVFNQYKYNDFIKSNGVYKTFAPDIIYSIEENEDSHLLKFKLNNNEKTLEGKDIENAYDNWKSFKLVYDFSNEKPVNQEFSVTIPANSIIYLYQLQLEEGQNQTPWQMSLLDTKTEEEKNIELGKELSKYLDQLEEEFNTSFTQEKLFAELSGGYNNMGIYMQDGYLFINANRIATGVISSQNWLQSGGAVDNDGNILARGTAGMSISLTTGQIDAHNFELNAWDSQNKKGLYLNSNPGEDSSRPNNNYYLKLGNDTTSYIDFDKDGNLSIKANSFELTGTLGGSNLLNDTEPNGKPEDKGLKMIRNVNEEDDFAYWRYVDSMLVVEKQGVREDLNDFRKYLRISNIKLLKNYRAISQDLLTPLKSGEKYILSGWIYIGNKTPQSIKFYLEPTDTSGTINDLEYEFIPPSKPNTWKYFSHIFEIPSDVDFPKPKFTIRDYNLSIFEEDGTTIKYNYYTYFYHLKLEEGTVATQWVVSEQDKKDAEEQLKTYLKDYSDNQLNDYKEQVDQDYIFNKLTNDGKVKGIFLHDGELYINATYLASNIIRSSNWKATCKFNGKDYEINEKKDFETLMTEVSKNPQLSITDIKATEGMYINLNTGKIWSKNFELSVGTKGEEDYLGLFSFTQLEKTTVGGHETGEWRIIAGKNFGVTKEGELYASSAHIKGEITATSGTIGTCKINEEGKLEVPAARITGTLSASQINTSQLFISTNNLTNIDDLKTQFKISTTFIDGDGNEIAVRLGLIGTNLKISQSGVLRLTSTSNMYLTAYSGSFYGSWNFPQNVSAAAEMSIDSDFNKKNTINKLTDSYENLFNLLIPVTYKYNNGTSDRLHTGFIAQDIENALTQSNLTSQDFAGLVIDTNAETNEVTYRLRYGEFVSLNTWQIQKLKARVLELENKILELEAKL